MKVNNASDDAAGSSVANKLASQLAGIKMALRNTADGISLVQTALSGMSNTMTLTQRLREITVQASSGVYTHSDRINAQSEVAELLAHIERCTGFALPERQRDVLMTHARAKLDRTRQAFLEAKAARKSVSTSRRAYLTDL